MRPPAAWPGRCAPANQPARPFSRLRREGRPAGGRRRLSRGFRACRRERALWRAPCSTCEPVMRPPAAWADRCASARSTCALRMFHVKHSFASGRNEAACSFFSLAEALHCDKVCACILRGDISSSTNAGVSSWPSRLRAAPSHRALPNASHRLPCSAQWLSRTTEPTAPFLIIPIDTSSTWVCPWCCDVSESDMTCPLLARPCAPLRGILSTRLLYVKHLYAL